MTLLERIAANRCQYLDCKEERAKDAQLCWPHLTDLLANRLDRVDGQYVARRRFPVRDTTWAGRDAA